jgi:hypothetical protein
LGDDRRLPSEVGVPAGVVTVEVRVDDELQLPGIDRVQRRLDLLRQREELIVHHQQTVRPRGDPDIPPLAL